MTNTHSKPVGVKFMSPLIAVFSQCYINAYKNQQSRYKHLNLKVVIGSLGLAGHFEYGGKHHTVKDFAKNPFDSHAWLEDDDGNVYDYIFPQYKSFAEYWGKKPTFPTNWEILGVSKKDLLEEGLEYIPAPEKNRADIINNVVALLKKLGFSRDIISGIKNI